MKLLNGVLKYANAEPIKKTKASILRLFMAVNFAKNLEKCRN